MTLAQGTAFALDIAGKDFGYSQGLGKVDGRWSGLDYRPGNFDCSAAGFSIAYRSGFIDREDLKGTRYSGNIIPVLTATGMYRSINVKGWSLTELKKSLREGDHLRGPGHVTYAVDDKGNILSFESDEHGHSTGGKPGDQTGREGRIRKVYARSGGWTHIARPVSSAMHKGRILAAYAERRSYGVHVARLTRRAPWDGPQWGKFMAQWVALDKGVKPIHDHAELGALEPGHVFVVLGSSKANMTRRLSVALPALVANPDSRALVTGGVLRAGVSEAAFMKGWLVDHGIAADRVFIETKAQSTIGNAKHSVPLLQDIGAHSYTIVSDASHVRRAQIEFLAAQLQRETAANEELGLAPTTPLSFNDYGDEPVVTAKPVTAHTRTLIATEVAYLLGLSAHFKASL